MKYKLDCIHFIGEKPCRYKRDCPGCRHYKKTLKRILIIKLGSLGDVLRTTPLAVGIKKKHPSSRITWLTKEDALGLLKNNPSIDEVLAYDTGSVVRLLAERFDILVSLDKVPEATGLAEMVRAASKMGFGMAEGGKPRPFNERAEYAFRLGVSDSLKFKTNKKSYQEIIFEISDLKYRGEEYVLNLSAAQKKGLGALRKKFGLEKSGKTIGFNTGCGDAFQGKKWMIENYLKLGSLISDRLGARIMLLGGPNEIERNAVIKEKAHFPLIDTGCDNSMQDFISIIDLCDTVVCGDTVAMHIAIALKKDVVALFGPTVPQEIDLYGRGKKIFSKVPCSPCYKRSCDHDYLCMKKITAEDVFKNLVKLSATRHK